VEIVEYQPHLLADVASLYAESTEHVPHCFAVEDEEVAAALAGECGSESEGRTLPSQAIRVALEGGRGIGFAHVGVRAPEGDESGCGVVRFLWYPRGRRDVGQSLLDAGEDWLRQQGVRTVLVYPQTYRYRFYAFAHMYLSDRLDHVQALFLFSGYRKAGGEVSLDWLDVDPPPPAPLPDLGIEVDVTQSDGPGRLPGFTVQARRDGEGVGQCLFLSAGAFSRRDGAQIWAFCDWLGVREPLQGKGLGRHLLQRGLVAVREAGYRHAAISTAWDNYRAFLFYTNYGFRVADWTYEFRRDLKE